MKTSSLGKFSAVAFLLAAGLLLLPGGLEAQDSTRHDGRGKARTHEHTGGAMADSAVPKDLQASMDSMMKDMEAMPMSKDPDHDFAMMMMRHHQAAIDMAKVELRDGKNTEMRQTAQKIIRDQSAEIEKLTNFLAKHGEAASGSARGN